MKNVQSNQKFTDNEFLVLYNQKLNDAKISRLLNVNSETIRSREHFKNLIKQHIIPSMEYKLK